MLRIGVVLALGLVCWVIYSAVVVNDHESAKSFVELLGQEFLAAAALGGLTSQLVTLLPLARLDGQMIYQTLKLRWALLYTTTLTLFLLLVLPDQRYWRDLGEQVWRWLIVLTVFALVSIAVFGLLNRGTLRSNEHTRL